MGLGYVIAGLVVGFMVGLTGVGGGSLMTPLLIFGFGLPPLTAVGTDLLFAALTKIGGIGAHWRHHTIQWRVVGFLALGSIPATLITLQILKLFQNHDQKLENLINTALGVALVLTALSLPLKSWLQSISIKGRLPRLLQIFILLRWNPRFTAISTVVMGGVLGFLVTLSSVGAGALGAVILLYLYPRLRMAQIVATDIAHAVPLTAIAGIGHWYLGSVDIMLLGNLLLGSLPGVYLGSQAGVYVSEKITRVALSALLMFIGIKFIF
ncbi:hypothetical conserved protein [Candidatus Nitrosoglobus terrae]|uniref:Probable membrane transporter protein n=1 Tax=Candidatus Nitrosoglobus terrae TaxID=1630141 RepID=A0A1Q2SLS2_9GAMM|nr:sulfite exporter TauE/SafE family protein [Candidatus Nitrosoglobus terrae]BAW80059.1 hypothetical conserved protein [Candidatus Nitrosoglobus terrae]